jgi:lysophospholipase L1-like esterase
MSIFHNLTFVLTLFLAGTMQAQTTDGSRLVTNLEAGKTQTVVAYGTSLTAGGAWVGQLQKELNTHYPGKAKVINSGGSGKHSTWGLNNLEARVIEKKPDTVFIEFAINDAFLKYETPVKMARVNLETMLDRILKANPACEIILMVMNPPIGVHLERRPHIHDYYSMYRDVAMARKLKLIDHYPDWDAVLKKGEEAFKQLVPDGIHPNADGCKTIITPNIIKALGLGISPGAPAHPAK